MGVYIKGMEMPKRGMVVNIHADGRVTRHFDEFGKTMGKAVSVQEPHGRLGDLDKLEKMFADIDSAPYSCFDGEEPFYSAEDAAHIIRLAPTIIPAEEGE